jgi:hypothetical protein
MSGRVGSNTTTTSGLVYAMDIADSTSYVSGSSVLNDKTRTGNRGTFANGTSFDSANKGSLAFDGVNDRLNITTDSVFKSETGTVTIWVNPANATPGTSATDNNTFLSFRGSNSREYFELVNVYDGTFQFTFRTWGDRFRLDTDDVVFADNTWTHVTVACNGYGIDPTLYINGVEQASTYNLGPGGYRGYWLNNIACSNIRVGSRDYNGSYQVGYPGKISSLKIYDRVLSSTEILNDYNSIKDRFDL